MYYHGYLSTAVTKQDKGRIEAKSLLLSTGYEAVGRMQADAGSFCVQDAVWQVLRSPDSRFNGGGQIGELVGAEAYLKAGSALRGVGQAHGDLPRQLMAECVKGIIQSESYLFKERGFSTIQEADDSWIKNNVNTCWLYSNMDRKSLPWLEYIADRAWGENLFNRSKNVAIHYDGGAVSAEGIFIDSFHELHISLEIEAGAIIKATSEFVRAPDPVCYETRERLFGYENKVFTALSRQEIGQSCGGGQGCAHLVDLLLYMQQTIQEIE